MCVRVCVWGGGGGLLVCLKGFYLFQKFFGNEHFLEKLYHELVLDRVITIRIDCINLKCALSYYCISVIFEDCQSIKIIVKFELCLK